MNKREKNKLLNEIFELRTLLDEKETLLRNAILEDKEDVSTSKGIAKYYEATTQMRFNMVRFKETSAELYKSNLIEVPVKEQVRFIERKKK